MKEYEHRCLLLEEEEGGGRAMFFHLHCDAEGVARYETFSMRAVADGEMRGKQFLGATCHAFTEIDARIRALLARQPSLPDCRDACCAIDADFLLRFISPDEPVQEEVGKMNSLFAVSLRSRNARTARDELASPTGRAAPVRSVVALGGLCAVFLLPPLVLECAKYLGWLSLERWAFWDQILPVVTFVALFTLPFHWFSHRAT
jgi:hypothetical protein